MKLPSPETQLANCIWLPRIIAKARALKAGQLPEPYVPRFCAPDGVDGQFLSFFGLKKDQIVQAAELGDAAIVQWFEGLPTVNSARIAEWNHIAINLGRPGFPLADRLPIAPGSKYEHLVGRGLQTIFEVLRADETTQ